MSEIKERSRQLGISIMSWKFLDNLREKSIQAKVYETAGRHLAFVCCARPRLPVRVPAVLLPIVPVSEDSDVVKRLLKSPLYAGSVSMNLRVFRLVMEPTSLDGMVCGLR